MPTARDDSTGILPDGMSWNRPLKAGELVLPQKTESKNKVAPVRPRAPSLPVGELKPPQIPASKKATPPLIASEKNSTASVMLLQGMKNALQRAGENPDIPKSDLEPTETIPVTDKAIDIGALASEKSEGAADSEKPVTSTSAEEGVVYQPGEEPKGFVIPKKAAKADAEKEEIVFPPEMVDAPKATEITEEPGRLEDSSAKPSVDAKSKADEDTSIFGAPVDEKIGDALLDAPPLAMEGDQAPSAIETNVQKTKTSPTCEPKVESWTRACVDAGYPATFVGQITGETRTECPSGEVRDVWLNNSCEASAAKDAPSAATEEVAQKPVPSQAQGPIDGACGLSNGMAAQAKPAADLCMAGDSTSVQGEGPWRWTCNGRQGGVTVSCAAPVAIKSATESGSAKEKAGTGPAATIIEDGKCGSADGVGVDEAPTAALCVKGAASRVNGGGPWTWACSGSNGGQAAACNAPRKTNGLCGPVANEGADGMPMRDLCTAGYASAVTGDGPWYWTCSGLHGGAATTCTAMPKVNAVCGQASLKGYSNTPSEGLCSVGAPSSVEGTGPWSWNCVGDRGGATVSCKAPVLVDGVCGSAHGSTYEKTPNEGLCATGTASRVTGLGPWNWTCSGVDGGVTASCTASLGTKEAVASVVQCGEATEILALAKPETKLCASGTASAVTGTGPWSWTCSDDAGHSAVCTTLGAAEGTCGKAANVAVSSAPKSQLCGSGTPGEVSADRANTSWKWDCQGVMGGSSVTCTAPISESAAATPQTPPATAKAMAQCGPASTRSHTERPASDLCEVGKATTVRGEGPWRWTCGSEGKKAVKVSCEAEKIVDAVCGSANGSIQKLAPTSDLCSAGGPTNVTGEGPWLWSCVGAGGGASVSCSASAQSQTKVDGTCGASANAITTATPTNNLCDSGMPSTVYGEGPWTWTCSGLNGGIASTCTSSKVMPKAPPPPGPLVNGLCGPSNGVAALSAPTDGLCSGGTVSDVSGDGPWNWSCIGQNGGMTVSCTAPLTPPPPIVGSCGASSGVPTMTTPKSGLCSTGIPSAVSGKGPWTWSCSGTNGGGAVSCVAPTTVASSEGLPSLTTPSLDSVAPAPKAAPVGLVTPQLPSGPLPPLKAGSVLQIKPQPPTADIGTSSQAPESAPRLPDGEAGVTPPPIRDYTKQPTGLKSPVLDSQGKPVSGARLVLEPELSTIAFTRGSDQLDKVAVGTLEKLANILMIHGNERITLVAYAASDGTRTPRDARRLSLNRALSVRDFLTNKGISSSRVDVRPMGANVPSGDMDRVDIRVN